ncbi:MAG: hypothetical protein EKK63_15835 [Acinetobacter sp.]|uniref:hypothetical protein n=1 Tax=Acinetobacter sp. TaxID=472 RepID=UPI000F98F46E|nr:hypothetical protein [Acinetobacter sp.]RUP37039.1 MAG: hypothetical protein EKK63_15835 [Acinetobacter sp.]
MSIKINLNLTAIKDNAAKTFKSKDKTKTYINLQVSELREPDQYGNTHTVFIEQTKEEREAKAPKIYVGNGKEWNPQSGQQSTKGDGQDLPF